MKRKCNKCHKSLPLTSEYFCKCSRCSDQLNYTCKKCVKEYQTSIWSDIQAYQKEYQKVYQTEHKEELAEYQKKYQYDRYNTDPEFKERMLARQRAHNTTKRKLKQQNDK